MNSASTAYMMKSADLETRWPSRKTVMVETSRSRNVSKRSQMGLVVGQDDTFIFFLEGLILAR